MELPVDDERESFTQDEYVAAFSLMYPEAEARQKASEMLAGERGEIFFVGDTLSLLSLVSEDAARRARELRGETEEQAHARMQEFHSRVRLRAQGGEE